MMHHFFESKYYNKPILESENFLVIPSLGSLVEGWLLIVPKKFYLNFSQLPSFVFSELETLISQLSLRFLPFFNADQFVIFEHGPTLENSVAGCGVDYAHLHWIPTNFDMLEGAKVFLNLSYDWQVIPALNSINDFNVNSKDYLYLRDQKGNHFLTCQTNIPSQTFRKVMAHYLNAPDSYDWKLNERIENIESVYDKLNFWEL
jgi:ATP adenylyltransferase